MQGEEIAPYAALPLSPIPLNSSVDELLGPDIPRTLPCGKECAKCHVFEPIWPYPEGFDQRRILHGAKFRRCFMASVLPAKLFRLFWVRLSNER